MGETKEVCHIEPEKVCETKTHTYKVITGYEDGECKEIEVCKFPGFHHKKRSAEPNPHYGHIVECEKETKEVCKEEPVVEEKTKEFEICHLEPKKVCEEKTFKVPTLDCEEEEKEKNACRQLDCIHGEAVLDLDWQQNKPIIIVCGAGRLYFFDSIKILFNLALCPHVRLCVW